MKKKSIDSCLVRWLKYMLENRITVATLQGTMVKKLTDKGMLQGFISSASISWNLISDDLYKYIPCQIPDRT